jgi:hypothetical protein
MNATTHPLVGDYLRQLARAARVLPRRQGEELVAEIREHLDTALTAESSEADVRNVLDGLGSPDEIVASARPDGPPHAKRGLRETAALILLLTGFPPILGWLAGVALLLSSKLWTARQKLLGILVWPGGALIVLGAIPLVSAQTRSCAVPSPGSVEPACITHSGASLLTYIAIAIVIIAPLVVTAYLYRAAGRRAGYGSA